MSKHEHDFLDCGYDEQQCDSACQATSHLCSVCGKSRREAAKELTEVRAHVADSIQKIIRRLNNSATLPTLEDTVVSVKACSQELDWLSREQLVEMAVWDEKHGHGRAIVR
jgi:hypothetical protein